jgi:aromatic-L-amino-acid/L-tryptophan decarboxylase
MLDGQLAIRAAIVNHRTEERDADALVEGVLKFGRAKPPASASAASRRR